MRTVPIVDLSQPGHLARDIDRACRDIGFLVIAGHGVPPPRLERSIAAAREFFALDIAEKSLCTSPDGRARGYTPVGKQGLAYSRGGETPPDLFERFRMGRFDLPDDEYHRARRNSFFAENVWPARPAGFADAMRSWYTTMEALAARLMRLFAAALDLPPGFFDDKI